MKITLTIGVEVYGGIVTDVHTFFTIQDALNWFKTYTGYEYGTDLGDTKFDQTKLFEICYSFNKVEHGR